MGQVTIRVGGYAHPVACQDGQEQHLLAMAAEVDRRIGALKAMGLQFGEARMLLLVALQLADEVHDLRAELTALKAAAASGTTSPSAVVADREAGLAARLHALADHIEAIAASLEQA